MKIKSSLFVAVSSLYYQEVKIVVSPLYYDQATVKPLLIIFPLYCTIIKVKSSPFIVISFRILLSS